LRAVLKSGAVTSTTANLRADFINFHSKGSRNRKGSLKGGEVENARSLSLPAG
jgi:hypothetical protein